MTTPRPRIAVPTYRYSPPANPPGADLITKAQQVAVSEVLQRAIEEVERTPTREPGGRYSWETQPRGTDDVKADALAVLRRLREENRS